MVIGDAFAAFMILFVIFLVLSTMFRSATVRGRGDGPMTSNGLQSASDLLQYIDQPRRRL
jgi:hypothetical protein